LGSLWMVEGFFFKRFIPRKDVGLEEQAHLLCRPAKDVPYFYSQFLVTSAARNATQRSKGQGLRYFDERTKRPAMVDRAQSGADGCGRRIAGGTREDWVKGCRRGRKRAWW